MSKQWRSGLLFIGAIGVVFGDLGTSPLYALQAIFKLSGITPTPAAIIGAISLIIWALIIVICAKYIGLIMRADNKGEGGAMALIALIRRSKLSKHRTMHYTILGLIGVSLYFGDSIITPAISVLSAMEGTKLIAPAIAPLVVPMTVIALIGLFSLQSRGTGKIGTLFGPIMITWFIVSALGGLMHIVQTPAILAAFNPLSALAFCFANPLPAFVAMGAVILAITGTEALCADMGHFGRATIAKAWFFLVFPALLCTYLGQGALVLHSPDALASPYFLLFPAELRIPIVLLATCATLIASQAVISGAFSLTRQAVALGFLPRFSIIHTSREELGQVYVPLLNWTMASLVTLTVIGFGSASNLASAFGMAVSGTLIIDSILFMVIIRATWRKPVVYAIVFGLAFLGLDLLFFSSNLSKLLHGAWLPIVLAIIAFIVLSTWFKGHRIILRERQAAEGSLQSFVEKLRHRHIPRVPGTAVYLGHNAGNAPLALHTTLEQLHELHQYVVIVSVKTMSVPHVPENQRVIFDGLGHADDNISHVTLKFGYKDIQNVPRALESARHQSSELDFDPLRATYFISLARPRTVRNKRLARWRKTLYTLLARNASNPTDFFRLPTERTIELTTFVDF